MTKRSDGYMRQSMPEVAKWLDQLFEAFGRETINRQIKRAMKGAPVFYAEESGHKIGTPIHVEHLVTIEPWHSTMPKSPGRGR